MLRNPLGLAGVFLILLGVFHLPYVLISDLPWDSPMGMRKPMLFGISTGATLLSLAWITRYLSFANRFKRNFQALLSAVAVIEVSIITFQTWRGVPAHFNYSTGIDSFLGITVDLCLVVLTIGILSLTRALFSTRSSLSASYLLAARWGMVYLSLSCCFGFLHAAYGIFSLYFEYDPHIVSPAGVPKFAHGISIHAIQLLPLMTYFFHITRVREKDRNILIHYMGSIVGLLTIYAVYQVVNGLPRFSPDYFSSVLLLGVLTASLVFCLRFIHSYGNNVSE